MAMDKYNSWAACTSSLLDSIPYRPKTIHVGTKGINFDLLKLEFNPKSDDHHKSRLLLSSAKMY